MRFTRTLAAALMSLLVTGVVFGLSGPAHAEDPYSYWLYYTVADGELVYQETAGPATFVPEDGGIEAYRYAAALYPPTQKPRVDLGEMTFDAVCGEEEADTGEKRVAVLIDYGVQHDAAEGTEVPEPEAACAVVPAEANGLQVLEAVGKTRLGEKSSLCAINGYPAAGCFEKADAVSPADGEPVDFEIAGAEGSSEDTSADEDDDSNLGLLAGIGAIVVALGAAGVFASRRNKSA